MNQETMAKLERRLGRVHARQRLGIERAHEAQVFGQGLNFFHPENWYSVHSVVAAALKLTGLYWRGRRNAERVVVRRNVIASKKLPPAFDGFTILHITDMHVEMNEAAMASAAALARGLDYDVCAWTGDYRSRTLGPYDATLAALAKLRAALKGPVYGVLGNHDTIEMVPGMEEMGVKVLLNESEAIARGGARIFLAGIDDAHYFRVDNIEKTASAIPEGEFAILLSHTPEIYRQAAHAGFDVLLAGHTHGGQICLPGGTPVILDSVLPRRLGADAWEYHGMAGYTSRGAGTVIVPVRLNCPPEVVLHTLRRA